MATTDQGSITGTKDALYDVIWFTEQSLSNALRLETYIADAVAANDPELAELFRKAQEASRRGGEEGKKLLAARIGADS